MIIASSCSLILVLQILTALEESDKLLLNVSTSIDIHFNIVLLMASGDICKSPEKHVTNIGSIKI